MGYDLKTEGQDADKPGMGAAPKFQDKFKALEDQQRGLFFDLVVAALFAGFFVLTAFGL